MLSWNFLAGPIHRTATPRRSKTINETREPIVSSELRNSWHWQIEYICWRKPHRALREVQAGERGRQLTHDAKITRKLVSPKRSARGDNASSAEYENARAQSILASPEKGAVGYHRVACRSGYEAHQIRKQGKTRRLNKRNDGEVTWMILCECRHRDLSGTSTSVSVWVSYHRRRPLIHMISSATLKEESPLGWDRDIVWIKLRIADLVTTGSKLRG